MVRGKAGDVQDQLVKSSSKSHESVQGLSEGRPAYVRTKKHTRVCKNWLTNLPDGWLLWQAAVN